MIHDAYLQRPFSPGRSAPSAGRLVGGIVMSVLAHGAAALLLWLLAALGWIGAERDGSAVTDAADVDVVAVSPQEWDRNRVDDPSVTPAARGAEKRREAQNPPKRPPEALPAGQVVDVATGNDEKPADSKYLAEHDNRVAKETRAREQTPFYGTAMPRQTTVQPPDAKAPQTKIAPKGNQGAGTDAATQSAKTQIAERQIPTVGKPEKASTLERSENGEVRALDDAQRTAGNSARLRVRSGGLASEERQADAQGQAGTPDAPAPSPSTGVLADKVGAAPNDYLTNLPTGDGTFLNTREFKYATFFNRVKQRVGEQWRPNDVLRRKGAGLEPQGRITVVDVTLDRVGRISDIRLSQSCGLQVLDEEAIASFERAQPFLNPPAGLLDEDGHVRFRFGFHIDAEPGNPLPAFRTRSRGRW